VCLDGRHPPFQGFGGCDRLRPKRRRAAEQQQRGNGDG